MTATLAEDILGDARRPVVHAEPTSQVTFRGVNERYREANYETVVLSGVYLAVEVLLGHRDRDRARGGRVSIVHESVEIGTLLAFTSSPTSSIRYAAQLYNRFSRPPPRSTGSPSCSTRSLRSSMRPPPASRRFAAMLLENVRFGYGGLPDVLHSFGLDVAPATTSHSWDTRAPGSRRSRSSSRGSTTLARGASPSTVTTSARSQESLRRQLGIVPQEGFCSATAIAANIAFAHPATRAEIEAAAEAVGADRFVKELPSGVRHRRR